MRERAVEDDEGDVLRLLNETVELDVELARGGVVRALDVSARPVVVAHVDDAVVLHGDLLAFDDSCELLQHGRARERKRRQIQVCALTSAVMYLSIAVDRGREREPMGRRRGLEEVKRAGDGFIAHAGTEKGAENARGREKLRAT